MVLDRLLLTTWQLLQKIVIWIKLCRHQVVWILYIYMYCLDLWNVWYVDLCASFPRKKIPIYLKKAKIFRFRILIFLICSCIYTIFWFKTLILLRFLKNNTLKRINLISDTMIHDFKKRVGSISIIIYMLNPGKVTMKLLVLYVIDFEYWVFYCLLHYDQILTFMVIENLHANIMFDL